ncbi:hypothetical protein L1277_000395 [Okibacterium sp. HSC-33S16]|uniref:hypothetical protein n=1 Tax=Okibacterium sp. HSC-33S16 TaxID=2910965 RepID=UPI00209F21EC|nr:hypothetical protein [Okibacterium sp. HSC-33S16]MCP2030331.1 hypothetical protein [Okibacterium sp. HSC-33S16]
MTGGNVRRSKAAWAAVTVLSTGVLLAVVGCTAQKGSSNAEPLAPAAAAAVDSATDPAWPVIGFGGSGVLSESTAVPKGANSLIITVVCTDGGFLISTGGDMSKDRRGGCGGAQTYTFSVTNSADLVVTTTMFKEDATFALTGEFSRDKTEPDVDTASDCEVISAIHSAVYNAKEGFKIGDIDGGDWLTVLAETRADLEKLGTNPSGLIGQQVMVLTEALAADHATPDSLAESKQFVTTSDLIGQACDANGTPLIIMAEYGG